MDNKNRYGGKRTEQKQGSSQPKRSESRYDSQQSKRSDSRYDSQSSKHSGSKYGSPQSKRSDSRYDSQPSKRSDSRYDSQQSNRSGSKYDSPQSKRPDSRYDSQPSKRSDSRYDSQQSNRSETKYDSRQPKRFEQYDTRKPKRFEQQRNTEKPRRFEQQRDIEKSRRFEPQHEIEQTSEINMEPNPNIIMGRNPVREAIKNGRSIDRILVSTTRDGSLNEIISLARERNIHIEDTGKAKLDELCMPFGYNGRPGNHQGIVAYVPAVEYCNIEDILAAAGAKNESPFVIVLDEINDPHNLGSIIRSAVCAGAHGIILPKRRSATVTAAVAKVSAGATEYANIARVPNIANAIKELKANGLWIAGGDMGGAPMGKADLSGPLALVIGGESEGLSRLIKEKCDYIIGIPMIGPLNSLNASVAAAILMFEKRRQDAQKQPGS